MQRRFVVVLLGLAALLGAAGAARADVVSDWNEVLLDAIRVDRTNPPRASRAMALVHVAVFDALNGVLGSFSPYHVADAAPAGSSPAAAVAAAAHRALSTLFPAQQATFDAALTASLAAVPDGPARPTAWPGAATSPTRSSPCAPTTARRRSSTTAPPPARGWWIPTPPGFAPRCCPNWPNVTPWACDQRLAVPPGPPPPPNSAEYLNAFLEVKRLGRVDSHFRTADQIADRPLLGRRRRHRHAARSLDWSSPRTSPRTTACR